MDELIRKAANGDRDAFDQLVERYQTQVYNLCLRMVGVREDALDLAQEAFLRAWKGLPYFQFGASFSTWLYRLTSNVCIDFLRAQKRRSVVSITFLDDRDEEKELDLPDPAAGPEDQAIQTERRELITRAMNDLPVEYRQVLSLRVLQDLSYAEIAELLDIKEGTVKSRIARAREQLRKNLAASGNKIACSSSNLDERGRSE